MWAQGKQNGMQETEADWEVQASSGGGPGKNTLVAGRESFVSSTVITLLDLKHEPGVGTDHGYL